MKSNFQLDAGVCYLDAASITPRAGVAAQAARAAVERSERPWARPGIDKSSLALQVRTMAASAIRAATSDVAITSAVSYGIATAASNLHIPRGTRILALEDDHPSAALMWQRTAEARGAVLEVVPRPANSDWTAAVRSRIRSGPRLSVVALPPLHWVDGTVLDLSALAPLVRSQGAALVIDATQAAGVMDLDVESLDADFVAFPAYKWMMGPYGLAFLYVHKRHHEGLPLEEHMGSRVAPALKEAGSTGDFSYRPGAHRFDRGERDDAIALAIAREGFALSTSVDLSAKQKRLWELNDRLCSSLKSMDLSVAPRELRGPHIIGIGLDGRSAGDLAQALESQGVFVSPRRGYLRVSPYLYNDEKDIDRFVEALHVALAATARR